MALVSTRRLTEMSTGIFLGVKGGRRVRLTILTFICEPIGYKCGSLEVSQTYEPPQPVRGIVFTFLPQIFFNIISKFTHGHRSSPFRCSCHVLLRHISCFSSRVSICSSVQMIQASDFAHIKVTLYKATPKTNRCHIRAPRWLHNWTTPANPSFRKYSTKNFHSMSWEVRLRANLLGPLVNLSSF
jgi:hypothetical protein